MRAKGIWLAYAMLFGFSVPWWAPAGLAEPIVGGFPLWALVSLGCYVGVAALTVFAIATLWNGGDDGEAPSGDRR